MFEPGPRDLLRQKVDAQKVETFSPPSGYERDDDCLRQMSDRQIIFPATPPRGEVDSD